MKKRWLAALLALALLLGMTPALSAAASAEDAPYDPWEALARQLRDPDADPFAFQTVPVREGINLLSAGPDFPASFDLRCCDLDGDGVNECYVTPVKLQNPFGNCWGFAAITAAETSILSSGLATQQGFVYAVTPDTDPQLRALDLSEKHLVYFLGQTVDIPGDPQSGEGFFYPGKEGDWSDYFSGGMPFFATGLFASGTGPVFEDSYDPSTDSYPFAYRGKEGKIFQLNGIAYCYDANDDWSIDGRYRFLQNYVLKESYLLPTPAGKTGDEWTASINAIKEQLFAGRAVQIGFLADQSAPNQVTGDTKANYISLDNWAHYTFDEDTGANHAVAVIGWDDNYPRENFAHLKKNGEDAPLPEHNGAWLVRNSWGSGEQEFPNRGSGKWGLLQGQDRGVYNETTGKWEYNAIPGAVHTGYFWLSYDDQSITMPEALAFDEVTAEEGYYLEQYDYMPVYDVFAGSAPELSRMANIFTAEADGILYRVSCQTDTPGTRVEYKVYLLNDKSADPMDGVLLATAEETYPYGGYHRAALDTPTILRSGQRYSVVVTQILPDGTYNLNFPLSSGIHGVPEGASYAIGIINPGESIIFRDVEDGGWFDMSDKEFQCMLLGDDGETYLYYNELDNFPIKAFLAMFGDAEDGPAAPIAKKLTYNGRAQALLTMPKQLPAGYVKVQFCVDGGAWSDDAPTAIYPGTYSVRVRYIGADGYRDFVEPPVSVTIAPVSAVVDWPDVGGGKTEPPKSDPEKTPDPAAWAFEDIAENAWYAGSVAWAVAAGVTEGTDETHFSPDLPCTRAQMITFLWRAAGSPEPTGDTLPFIDTEPGSYYDKAVRWAVAAGITTGVDETHFAPDAPITRAQAVVFLFRCFGGGTETSKTAFTDVPEDAWYADAVAWAAERGITDGVDATHFAPALDCTRAQVVTFLFRAFSQTQSQQ